MLATITTNTPDTTNIEAPNYGLAEPHRTILNEISDYLTTYMHFENPDHAFVLSLYVLHTYTFSPNFPRAPWTTPYIYISSTGPACGKSLLLDLLSNLCHRSRKTGSMSAAAMFRIIEDMQPTLMVDEIDTVLPSAARSKPCRYHRPWPGPLRLFPSPPCAARAWDRDGNRCRPCRAGRDANNARCAPDGCTGRASIPRI